MDPHQNDHLSSPSKEDPKLSPAAADNGTNESDSSSDDDVDASDKAMDKLPSSPIWKCYSTQPTGWFLRQDLTLSENEYVTIKAKTPVGNPGVLIPEIQKIPKAEAVCRFCYNVFQENMIQTYCKCEFTMIHESCETEWSQMKGNNKCDACELEIQNIYITVSAPPQGTSNEHEPSSSGKRSLLGCFGR